MVPPLGSALGLSRSTGSVLGPWWQLTWNYSSVEVEVFEWDLKPEHANELYDVLG